MKIKAGTIVHFPRFAMSDYQTNVWARVTEDWELALDPPDGCGLEVDIIAADGDLRGELIYDGPSALHYWTVLIEERDSMRVVPEDEVPDWVWGKLAECTLLGELTEGDCQLH